MKQIMIGIVLLLSATFSFAQRQCASHDNLQQMILNNPEMVKTVEYIERHTQDFISKPQQGKDRAVITIPVVFHIVWRTGKTVENISDAQVQSQLDVINKDFRKLNTDVSKTPALFAGLVADAEIQFCMAQRDPNGVATTGIVRYQSARTTDWGTNDAVKIPNTGTTGGYAPWDASKYLNFWVCSIGGGILGYAQFPGGAAATDGVVIDYRYFGTTGTATSPFHLGRTATHEIGHWLNLRHIWGDANCGTDSVTDTPTHTTSNGGCPAYPKTNTCNSTTNTEMTMNYMDYTDDACMYMFSTGQKARMQALFATGGSRASLLTSNGCTPGTAPTCGTPTTLAAASITTTGATLSWAAVTGASSYTIQYKTAAATTWTTLTGNTTTSRALTGLTAATAYSYQVAAVCSSVTGSYSTASTFTTSAAATCGTPTTLAAASITTTGATLSWAAVTGASSYTIQYKTAAATTWTTLTGNTTTSRALTGLTAATAYSYQVAAVCSSVTGSYSAASTFTTSAVATCGTPTTLAAASITTTGATLNWATVTGASSYKLQYKKAANTTWTTVNSLTTTSRVLTGLTAGTAYDFQVAAVCGTLTGSYSAAANFTTNAACTDPYENNNTFAKAFTLTPGTYTALISSSSDQDWFKVTTTAAAKNIRATISNLPADYDVALYSASNTLLSSSLNTGTANDMVKYNAATGAATYYIKVHSLVSGYSSTDCYTLTIETSASNLREIGQNQEDNVVALDFSIYPNPANDEVVLNFATESSFSTDIAIHDMTGRIIGTQNAFISSENKRLLLDVSGLENGFYFITARNSAMQKTAKLMIER